MPLRVHPQHACDVSELDENMSIVGEQSVFSCFQRQIDDDVGFLLVATFLFLIALLLLALSLTMEESKSTGPECTECESGGNEDKH